MTVGGLSRPTLPNLPAARPRVKTALGIGLAGAGVGLHAYVGLWPMPVSTQLVVGVGAVVLVCASGMLVVTGLHQNAIAQWRLGPWYLMWAAFAFGLASLTWLAPQQGTSAQVAPESVVAALTLLAAATIVWIVGYAVGVPSFVHRNAARGIGWLLRGTTPVVRGGAVPWVLYGAGTLARLASIVLTGRLGYVGDVTGLGVAVQPFTHALDAISTLALFGVAAAAHRAYSPSIRSGKITFSILVVMETVVGALAGGKQAFFVVLLAVLVPYGAIRRRLPARVVVPAGLLLLFVVYPFNVEYRQVVRSGAISNSLSPAQALESAPGVLNQSLSSDSPAAVMLDSATNLVRRVRLIDSVAIIMQRTPSTIPYQSPLDYMTAPLVGLIPRAVWSDKPVFSSGYQFAQEYYGMPSTVLTAAAITPLGDLYRHGGWTAALAGMFVLGLAWRLFDRLFQPELDPRALCFLLVFLPSFVKSEMDIYGLIIGIPSGILTATLGIHLMFRRASKGEQGAALSEPH